MTSPLPRRLPAEWEPQSAVMLAWPHAGTDWADQLEAAEQTFFHIAAAVAANQTLLVVCHDDDLRRQLQRRLPEQGVDTGRVLLAVAPCNDTWARDFGALTLSTRQGPLLMDFRFNAWGGKFDARQDDRINRRLQQGGLFAGLPMESLDFVLEGGALETDGEGALLATRHSLVTHTRNPGLDTAACEALLREQLGIQRFLWLDHGALSGDDTDGHIDTLARFADSRTIVHVTPEPDENDPDRPGLQAMIEELRKLRTADDKPYRLVGLPPCGVHTDPEDGRRLPATYANFLIINGAVLLPVYGGRNDEQAVSILQATFPAHDIIPIDCRPLIRQNGSLHCVTMQFPAAVPLHAA